MASHKARVDTQLALGNVTMERRAGTYWQPSLGKQEGSRYDTRQVEQPRRGQTIPQPGRAQLTGLPRPSLRSPSPTTRSMTDPQPTTSRSAIVKGPVNSTSSTKMTSAALRPKDSRNVLRRKQSSVAQHLADTKSTLDRAGSTSPSKWSQLSAENRPSIESSLRSNEAYTEIFSRTRERTPAPSEPMIYPELDRYRTAPEQSTTPGLMGLPPKLSTTDLPPPTPLLSGTPLHSGSSSSHHRYSGGYSASGYSASPSTRFSESPGPGAFSRNTTPTSMSSQSPGMFIPVKPLTPRLQQGSPAQTRPPVTRRRTGSNANASDTAAASIDPQGLPSLRESLTSSSSNSTVKNDPKTPDGKEKRKKKRLSPLPPSPPPRKSSQKFKKSPSTRVDESPTKLSSKQAKSVMTSPTKTAPAAMKSMAPTSALSKTIPPTRPSRDGAPDLRAQPEPIAVVQSNLTSIPFAERRRSGIARPSPQVPQLTPNIGGGSRGPSRNPSPSPIQPASREPTPAPTGLGIIPDLKPQSNPKSGLRTPSPSVTSHKHRFGLFGRRKTAPDTVPTEKAPRKGPAAGTGHEGYGRYAPRGRSISSNSGFSGRERSISAASSSMESVASTRTHDPFLLDRMSPVIIAGGEVIENHNVTPDLTRVESNNSVFSTRPSTDSKNSSRTNLSTEVPKGGLLPSAMSKDATRRLSAQSSNKGRRPSDSSDDGFNKGPLAFRRSILKGNGLSTGLVPPKSLTLSAAGSSVTSLNASLLSDDSIGIAPEPGLGRHGQITKSKKLEKRPGSPKKWNIFQRSKSKADGAAQQKKEEPVAVTVGREPVKAIPHYALLDSSDELPDYLQGVDLDELMAGEDVADLSDTELDRLQFGELKESLNREREQKEKKMKIAKAKEEKLPAMLFTSPSTNKQASQATSDDVKQDSPARPARLAQVGRIPKVVPARPQATSPKSFSRPFARLSMTQATLEPVPVDKESIGLGPSPPKPDPLFPGDSENVQATETPKDIEDPKSDEPIPQHTDFLTFSPRKGSVVTTSSSSNISHSEIVTAVVPDPETALAEDEVWNEYDDLLGTEHTGKARLHISTTSSQGEPFRYENYETKRLRQDVGQPKESPTIASIPRLDTSFLSSNEPARASILTTSSVYSQEMNPKLKESLAAITTPTTPMSFTDFISGYGDRNNSVQGDSAKKPQRLSRSSSRKSDSDSGHQRTQSGLLPIIEQPTPVDPSPTTHVNLRLGSMTVSKWLTFGRVLFSPARESIIAAENDPSRRHSILVIDGLGNDDWSFYAADIYPTATFYNLSPTRPLSASQRASSSTNFPHTPANHRQVQYLSPTQRFPFPSAQFHVVVFRFPPSLPLASYQNVINEARRVLLPGGYLELAILDMDMMNMGPRARRAMRSLKMAMQARDVSGFTGSASDTILKFIGKRGFESVKTCNVSVPVATPLTAPVDIKGKQPETQDDKSFADLSLMSKVGRWWFNRCYETGGADDSRGSIFNDATLIKESEEWNSSFKLVVAHARKPIAGGIRGGGRRRTLSV